MQVRTPHIWHHALPEAEQGVGEHMNHLLHDLAKFVWRYDAALRLSEHSAALSASISQDLGRTRPGEPERGALRRRKAYPKEWRGVALRDAAFTIRHVGITLDSILKGAANAPTLKGWSDSDALHKAQTLFKRRFKRPEDARNGVRHEADFAKTAEARQKHAHVVAHGSPLAAPFTACDLQGSLLFSAIEGRLGRVELSQSGLDALSEVRDIVFSAFRPASETSQRLSAEATARSLGWSAPRPLQPP